MDGLHDSLYCRQSSVGSVLTANRTPGILYTPPPPFHQTCDKDFCYTTVPAKSLKKTPFSTTYTLIF